MRKHTSTRSRGTLGYTGLGYRNGMATHPFRRFRTLAGVAGAGLILSLLIAPAKMHEPRQPAPTLEQDESDATRQRVSPMGAPAPTPASLPVPTTACPEGMMYVEGDFCPSLAHICKRFIDEKKDRCAEFLPTSRCFGRSLPKRFCMDQFEYPNRTGEKPLVAVTFLEAQELCRSQNKRLCTADEWTLACEGQGRIPYPYGYRRDEQACNIDRPYILPNDSAYANLATRQAEVARLDQREPSGARPACVSPFGVFDMTGNVDEWTTNERGKRLGPPYVSGLKGGYWGPVRNRCRPITATHNQWHSGYQIGLRCCLDPGPGTARAAAERR